MILGVVGEADAHEPTHNNNGVKETFSFFVLMKRLFITKIDL